MDESSQTPTEAPEQTQEQAQEPLVEQQQQPEPQEATFKQPEVEDTYDEFKDRQEMEAFEKQLDERFPLKGKVDLNSIDRKDPNAINEYFNSMQENTRNDIANEQQRARLTEEFKTRQEAKHWDAAYKAYPNLKGTPTETLVRQVVSGVKSPLQAANLVNKLAVDMYNAGFRSAKGAVKQVPSKPLGRQGKTAPAKINRKAINEKAGGEFDDIVDAVAALAEAGEGGL